MNFKVKEINADALLYDCKDVSLAGNLGGKPKYMERERDEYMVKNKIVTSNSYAESKVFNYLGSTLTKENNGSNRISRDEVYKK